MNNVKLYGEVSDMTSLYQLVKDLLDTYKANIEKAGAVAEGSLRTAATYSMNQWDFKWKGETLSLVLRLPDHYYYIEEGRGPTHNNDGGELLKAIMKWIEVKHIVPHPDPKTYKVPTTKQLAFLITRKIHREGFFSPGHHGKHLLMDAIASTDIASRMVGVLTDQFNRAVKVELSQQLSRHV